MVLKSKAVFLVLLLLFCHPFCGLGEDWSTRRLSSRHKVIPGCGELVLKSECSENSKCRWCTSEDLDDMCFSKSEALRLPHQVFSCAISEIRWYQIYSLLDLCAAYLTDFRNYCFVFLSFFYIWLHKVWRWRCIFGFCCRVVVYSVYVFLQT